MLLVYLRVLCELARSSRTRAMLWGAVPPPNDSASEHPGMIASSLQSLPALLALSKLSLVLLSCCLTLATCECS